MTRARWRAPLALALSLGLVAGLAACGDDDDSADVDTETIDGPTIRIAPQDFNEAKVLTEIYAQYLEAEGFDVDLQAPNGFRDSVYPDLEADDLDLIIDYTGSAARFLNSELPAENEPAEAFSVLQAELAKRDLQASDYAQAEDRNALVVLKSLADEKGLTTISDLAKLGTVKLAGAEDCRDRVDCLKGYEDPAIYGLTVDFTAADYGTLIDSLKQGLFQAVQFQQTSPDIGAGTVVVLEDDKGILSADSIVPVFRTELGDAYGEELTVALDAVSSLLSTQDLNDFAVATDVDKEEPADVAAAWLEAEGLV